MSEPDQDQDQPTDQDEPCLEEDDVDFSPLPKPIQLTSTNSLHLEDYHMPDPLTMSWKSSPTQTATLAPTLSSRKRSKPSEIFPPPLQPDNSSLYSGSTTGNRTMSLAQEVDMLRAQIKQTRTEIQRYKSTPSENTTLFAKGTDWKAFEPDFLASAESSQLPTNEKELKQTLSSRDLLMLQHQQADLETHPGLQDARRVLGGLGVQSLAPKVKLYAHLTMHKGVVKLVSKEFVRLMAGSMQASAQDFVGRSLRDFHPPAFEQWVSYMFHRELLASGSSSIIFDTVLARLDGSIFRCLFGFSMFWQGSQLAQTICTVHLNTVQELDVPKLGKVLPRKGPPISLEVDYVDSPQPKRKKSL